MSRLTFLKHLDPEASDSPELRYLLSLCRLEAVRVYDRVDLLELPPAGDLDPEPPESPIAGHVLLVGEEPVFFTARTLATMRRRIEEGASVVVPVPLAEAGIPGINEIYTLRDYEEAERRYLQREKRPEDPPRRLGPIALLSARAFDALTESGRRGGSLRALESRFDREPRLERAGLYHEFIDYYGEIRTDVLPHLPETVDDLLEVGCGRGVTGAMLQELLDCSVTGVELNAAVAEEARGRLHRVVTGDVAKVDLGGRFDVILALELVEHLPSPEPVLRRLGSLLRPGGRIVLSVPNVGHHSVVMDLLQGRWDYLPIGLLCYTHLRFFTRRTLEDWLQRTGFDRFTLVPQKTPIPDEVANIPVRGLDVESLTTKGFWVLIEG